MVHFQFHLIRKIKFPRSHLHVTTMTTFTMTTLHQTLLTHCLLGGEQKSSSSSSPSAASWRLKRWLCHDPTEGDGYFSTTLLSTPRTTGFDQMRPECRGAVYRCDGAASWMEGRKEEETADASTSSRTTFLFEQQRSDVPDSTGPSSRCTRVENLPFFKSATPSTSSTTYLLYREAGTLTEGRGTGDENGQGCSGAANGGSPMSLPFQQSYVWIISGESSAAGATSDEAKRRTPFGLDIFELQRGTSSTTASSDKDDEAWIAKHEPLSTFRYGGEDRTDEQREQTTSDTDVVTLTAEQNSCGGYICGPDRYHSWLQLDLAKRKMLLSFRIRGPHKNYTTVTELRLEEGDERKGAV
ncbi:unnamed protein product [Amoebophrya sp. A25]|nr:unnamed protein product [Amoebophrya sp. A25]|eukprot:GSA25T00019249001.1